MNSTESVSIAQIADVVSSFGVPVSAVIAEKIQRYLTLLQVWSKQVSLTAIDGTQKILQVHFGESLFALKAGDVEKGRLADVGSGAGFPGLPLAIANSHLDVTLIEPNAKKATFLAEVIRKLPVDNACVERSRIPQASATDKFDFVTARALGDYPVLLRWAEHVLAPSGRVVLWLGRQDSEKLARLSDWKWQRPIPVPGSRERVLLIGSPGGMMFHVEHSTE